MNYSTGSFVRTRDRIIGGVAGGIAKSTGIDVSIVRVVLVVLAFFSVGTVAAIYAILWAVVPVEGEDTTVLDSLIDQGKKTYSDYKGGNRPDNNVPSSEPGPAPRHEETIKPTETFDPYAEDHNNN